MTAKIIAIALQKGGVAKTTVTRHLGQSIAQAGRRVLLVDLDPQASLTSIVGAIGEAGSMFDVLGDVEAGWDDVIPIIEKVDDRLDIAPAHADLAHTDAGLVLRRAREYVLRRSLGTVVDRYDYILLDCPPSLGLLLSNALIAAQWVIIPTLLDSMSLKSIGLFLDTLDAMERDYPDVAGILGTVAVAADMRTVLARAMLEELRGRERLRMFDTVIPATVRFPEAALMQQSIFAYAPDHAGAVAFEELTRELLSRVEA